jgi:tetratricopeptide (TPR) repeat protein
MFEDDEEHEDYFEGNLTEDLERFEAFLNGGSLGYLDSDRLEAIIDHYLITNQYNKAKLCAEHALGHFSFSLIFSLRRAQAMSAMGQLKEALNIIAQIEKVELPTCETLLTKASIFSQLRDSKTAIKYYKESLLLSEPEDRDEIYLDLAVEHQNMNDYKGALLILEKAMRHNPQNEGAIYELAFCYDQLGDYEKAVKCYSDFIDENPYSFTAWYNLGNAFSKSEDFEKAVWAYDYCVLLNEDFGPVYFNLGNAYLSMDKYQLSIDNFNRSMELDGEDPVALCYIGEAHEQLGELQLAKEFYKQSLLLAPLLSDAWLGLGIVEDMEGNTRQGIALFNKALELDPENASVFSVLAAAYEKLDDFDLAKEYYLMALSIDPLDEECLTSYINFLIGTTSLKSTFQYLKDFLSMHPDNEVAPLLKVNLLWKLGRKKEALLFFSTCLEKDKANALDLFEIYPEFKEIKGFIQISEE